MGTRRNDAKVRRARSSDGSVKPPIPLRRLLAAVIVVLVAGFFGIDLIDLTGPPAGENAEAPQGAVVAGVDASASSESPAQSQRALVDLARRGVSGEMVLVRARVVKVLPDDSDGSRHQRFLLAIEATPSPTASVLVAHNIDLAPRVPVRAGDMVRVYGQYECNELGGVLHWTHHDPGGRRAGGWIEHAGKRYE